MKPVEAFFRELDARWTMPTATRIRLPIIGSAALLLQTDYDRGTKDSDVLPSPALDAEAQERLLSIGGRGTSLHERHRIYLEFVPNGLPFLPSSSSSMRGFAFSKLWSSMSSTSS
jgi:hypothetical protein